MLYCVAAYNKLGWQSRDNGLLRYLINYTIFKLLNQLPFCHQKSAHPLPSPNSTPATSPKSPHWTNCPASHRLRRRLHPASCAPAPTRWDERCTSSSAFASAPSRPPPNTTIRTLNVNSASASSDLGEVPKGRRGPGPTISPISPHRINRAASHTLQRPPYPASCVPVPTRWGDRRCTGSSACAFSSSP